MPAIRPISLPPPEAPHDAPDNDAFLMNGMNPFLKPFKGIPGNGVSAPMIVNPMRALNNPDGFVQPPVVILSNNAFGIMPGMFKNQLARNTTEKIPRLYDPATQRPGSQVGTPIIPSEEKGVETVKTSWGDANKAMADDLEERMKDYFKMLKEPSKDSLALRGKKVNASVWVEDLTTITASAGFGVTSKTWTASLELHEIQGGMRDIFEILSGQGYGWYSPSPLTDLYKSADETKEIAVYSDGENLSVTAFTI